MPDGKPLEGTGVEILPFVGCSFATRTHKVFKALFPSLIISTAIHLICCSCFVSVVKPLLSHGFKYLTPCIQESSCASPLSNTTQQIGDQLLISAMPMKSVTFSFEEYNVLCPTRLLWTAHHGSAKLAKMKLQKLFLFPMYVAMITCNACN